MVRRPITIRVLNDARHDDGYRKLKPSVDLRFLMSFIDRLNALGWLPPSDGRDIAACAAFGALHHSHEGVSYYEFCLSGARGERDPWITVIFHYSPQERVVRILMAKPSLWVSRHRKVAHFTVHYRLHDLLQWLKRHENRNS